MRFSFQLGSILQPKAHQNRGLEAFQRLPEASQGILKSRGNRFGGVLGRLVPFLVFALAHLKPLGPSWTPGDAQKALFWRPEPPGPGKGETVSPVPRPRETLVIRTAPRARERVRCRQGAYS